jgi:hypothetical protein
MEKKLLKLFELADFLNEKQDKVFAQITYSADDSKKLEIAIRSKEDFSFIEKCEIRLKTNPLIRLDKVIELFKNYISGTVKQRSKYEKWM